MIQFWKFIRNTIRFIVALMVVLGSVCCTYLSFHNLLGTYVDDKGQVQDWGATNAAVIIIGIAALIYCQINLMTTFED